MLRENIHLRRAYRSRPRWHTFHLVASTAAYSAAVYIYGMCRLTAPNGITASYLHISPAPGLGRIGSMVALEGTEGPIPDEKLDEIQAWSLLCAHMHIH